MLDPGNHRYLFTLPTPIRLAVTRGYQERSDGVIELWRAVHAPLRYRVWSAAVQRMHLPIQERRAALQVPASTVHAVRALARQFKGSSQKMTIQHVMAWFHGASFQYTLTAPKGYPHGQSIADFLLKTHTGYCEYYAGGLALLLRLDGVPTRVITGYRGGQYDAVGHFWIVRQSMAHAWVQAWLPQKGWVRLDATPAAALSMLDGHIAKSATSLSQTAQIFAWMRWEWMNTIIDFTPSRQSELWAFLGHGLKNLVSAQWHMPSMQMPKLQDWSTAHPPRSEIHDLLALGGVSIFLLLGLWWRRKGRPSAEARLRARAARLLRSVGWRDERPGQEEVFWDQQYTLAGLATLYRAQRYGRTPTTAQESEIRNALKAWRRSNRSGRGRGTTQNRQDP